MITKINRAKSNNGFHGQITPYKRTILIVDDEVLNLQLLSELLTGEGYAVVCISNSEEAVATVTAGQA